MEFPKSGFLRRLVALSIDITLLDILGAGISYPLYSRFSLDADEIFRSLAAGADLELNILVFLLLNTVFLAILWGFYFIYFTSSTGQTPGKKLLGIQVERVDECPMDLATASVRFFGYGVSLIPFFSGFLWALFDRRNETWHDKLSRTHVIQSGW